MKLTAKQKLLRKLVGKRVRVLKIFYTNGETTFRLHLTAILRIYNKSCYYVIHTGADKSEIQIDFCEENIKNVDINPSGEDGLITIN